MTLNTAEFGCNEGYSPQERLTAVCTDTWSPDPAQLECNTVITTTKNDGGGPGGRCYNYGAFIY